MKFQISKLKIGESVIASSEAPFGAKVTFKGMPYTKGNSDQPTWIPQHRTGGFLIMIPQEDHKNYQAIEQAWHDSQKELTPEQTLQILKAPASKKQALIDKFRHK